MKRSKLHFHLVTGIFKKDIQTAVTLIPEKQMINSTWTTHWWMFWYFFNHWTHSKIKTNAPTLNSIFDTRRERFIFHLPQRIQLMNKQMLHRLWWLSRPRIQCQWGSVLVCVFVFAVRISVKGLMCSQCGHESIPSPQGVQSQFYHLSALICVCDSESQREENTHTRA